MPLNLINQAWLPVRRMSGEVSWLRPAELSCCECDDPPAAFAWARPDLDAASFEFMVGLLSTLFAARIVEIDDWREWWDEPPGVAELDKELAIWHDAFQFGGERPCFMQDLTLEDGSEEPISALLIDNPGANAVVNNTDHFIKRGRIGALSLPAAAIALFLLQSYAPSGGAGHRVGLRGGGPMSCFVMPGGERVSLWHQLWLNVYAKEDWQAAPTETKPAMPWLVPTRESSKGANSTPEQHHPALCFWGMPRRIVLNIERNSQNEMCAITGQVPEWIVKTFQARPYGNNYEAWGGRHPLSPHYRSKKDSAELLALHPQPGMSSYSDWLGIIVQDEHGLRLPALIVDVAKKRLRALHLSRAARLRVVGFDTDNMKARGFVEHEIPIVISDEAHSKALDRLLLSLILSAREACNALISAVSLAQSNTERGKGSAWIAQQRFWSDSEPEFLQLAGQLPERLKAALQHDPGFHNDRTIQLAWLDVLRRHAVSIFDNIVPPSVINAQNPKPYVNARGYLTAALYGFGKSGASLFKSLDMQPPKPKKSNSKQGKAA